MGWFWLVVLFSCLEFACCAGGFGFLQVVVLRAAFVVWVLHGLVRCLRWLVVWCVCVDSVSECCLFDWFGFGLGWLVSGLVLTVVVAIDVVVCAVGGVWFMDVLLSFIVWFPI